MDNGKGLSITSLIFGIVGAVGIFLSWTPLCFLFLALAIVGLVLAVLGRKKSAAAEGKASGLATAGLVLCIIAIVFAGLGVLCYAACAGAAVASEPTFYY